MAVPREKVLQLLVVNGLINPGGEFPVHWQSLDRSAMDELLGEDFTSKRESAMSMPGSRGSSPSIMRENGPFCPGSRENTGWGRDS